MARPVAGQPPPEKAGRPIARNKSPQTFEKRKREIEKRRKREAKMERRLDRKYWKTVAKENGEVPEGAPEVERDEYGEIIERGDPGPEEY